MKFSRIKFCLNLVVILLLIGGGYYYRADLGRFWQWLGGQSQLVNNLSSLNKLPACQKPITYSIANLDSRFGLTQTELLAALSQAGKIWSAPIGKQLFEYSPTGDLKINLVYDYRQQASDALKKVGIVVDNNQSTYDALKAKYNSLVASYKKAKTHVDTLVATYNKAQGAYDKNVNFWNSHGGAPPAEFNILEKQRLALNNQISAINQAENSLNGLADMINSAELVLNKLIATLNLQVNTYNAIGSSTGKIFNEGEYVSTAAGNTINIFQFENNDQLVRVLAHEFGHALGLEHLSNPKAIMYYLNEGVNEKLTADDLAALKSICKIN